MTFTASDITTQQPEEPAVNHVLCDECRAPVALDQRYCVACGTRQTHADNPAVDYFATTASARREGGFSPASAGRSGITPLSAVLLALLPLAVAIGVLVGRGTGGGNDNAALLNALRRQQPIVVTTGAGAASGSTTTAPSTGTSTAAPKASTKTGTSVTKTASASIAVKHTTASSGAKAPASSGSSASGAQGQAIVNKEKSETGSNYVKGQSSLPQSITIPSSGG